MVDYVRSNTGMEIILVEQLFNPDLFTQYIYRSFYAQYQRTCPSLPTVWISSIWTCPGYLILIPVCFMTGHISILPLRLNKPAASWCYPAIQNLYRIKYESTDKPAHVTQHCLRRSAWHLADNSHLWANWRCFRFGSISLSSFLIEPAHDPHVLIRTPVAEGTRVLGLSSALAAIQDWFSAERPYL